MTEDKTRETLPFNAWELAVMEEAVKMWAERDSSPHIARVHAEQLAARLSFANPRTD